MSNVSAQNAYDQLYKFFGLRGRDKFLTSIEGQKGSVEESKAQSKKIVEIFNDLYCDSTINPSFLEIIRKMNGLNLEELRKIFCITSYTEDLPGAISPGNLPMNTKPAGKYNEQGVWGNPIKIPQNKMFTVSQIDGKKFTTDSGEKRIDVIQVFPVRQVPEIADTDILTLYMSTINNLNMSRAVPFIDIMVSVPLSGSVNEGNAPFSLNTFLGGGNSKDANAKFVQAPLTTTLENRQGFRQAGVASMEIFTTPQTLVNATKTSYNQNTDVGTAFDAFRPFLAIENFSIRVVSSGAGVISNKTADMKLRLFDRGRLQEVAPLIAPSRFRAVQLDIEYGWSHPSGKSNVRYSDANIEDRIGQLIDSMRVRESFMVANSNFSFEQDGSVSITLKLSMVGTSRLVTEEIQFGDVGTDVKKIHDSLEEIKKISSEFKGAINIPQILLGDADSFVAMEENDLKSLNRLLKNLNKNGTSPRLATAISKLITPSQKKGLSLYTSFQKSRKDEIDQFINKLKFCNDPFLRTDGLAGAGPTMSQLNADSKKGRNYVSLGTLLIAAFGDNLQRHGNVLYTFGCFNSSAAAMYDHNIAQFPIKLTSTDKNEFTLQKVLQNTLAKVATITPQTFMKIINDAFLERQSTDAYGLAELFESANGDPNKVAYKNKQKKDENDASFQLAIEEMKTRHLEKIYGGRQRPTFIVPKLNMKIDCKKQADGENMVKVIITDTAASNIGDIQRIFDQVTTQGFFTKERIEKKDSVRSAQHGEIAEYVYQALRDNDLLEEVNDVFGKIESLIQAEDKTAALGKTNGDKEKIRRELNDYVFVKEYKTSDTRLRDVFYNFFPTIIYGSMGSGIISAQLTSNQNDALTTINIAKQYNQGDEPVPIGMPMMIHPTQLSMEVFGSPLFKYAQTFFIDFGTGTSADNFYAVTGVDMNFAPGEFKCSLKLTQRDAFGRFMRIRDNALNTLVSIYKNESKKTQIPRSNKKNKGGR